MALSRRSIFALAFVVASLLGIIGANHSSAQTPLPDISALIPIARRALAVDLHVTEAHVWLAEVDVQVRDNWAFGTAAVFETPDTEIPWIYLYIARLEGGQWAVAPEGQQTFRDWLAIAPSFVDERERNNLLQRSDSIDRGNGEAYLGLPWMPGETWRLTGGTHNNDYGLGHPRQNERPWSAIDFSDPFGQGGRVRAAREGTIYISDTCPHSIRVNHADGWTTGYFHVANVVVSNGQWVNRWDQLATQGTWNCTTSGVVAAHVHLSLRRNGVLQNFAGHTVGGHIVRDGTAPYTGCLYRYYDGVTSCPGEAVWNEGMVGSGWDEAPANSELVRNGGFNTDTSSWTFAGDGGISWENNKMRLWRSPGSNGARVYQYLNYGAPALTGFEVTAMLANTAQVAQDINLILRHSELASIIQCSFTLPPMSSSTYSMRRINLPLGYWPNIRLEIVPLTISTDGSRPILVDNVSVQNRPDISMTDIVDCQSAPDVAPPSNDEAANALVVDTLPYDALINVWAATKGADPDQSCIGIGGPQRFVRSVWFRYTPPYAQTLRLEALENANDYDTIMTVYTGSPGNFTEVACNDDIGGGNLRSLIPSLSVNGGTTYWIMVTSWTGTVNGQPYDPPNPMMLYFHVEALATPTPTPTNTFTFTPPPTHTFTPTWTPTFTPPPTYTFTSTYTPSPTNTFTPTRTFTSVPTFTPTPTRTFTSTYTPTPTNTFTAVPTFTPTPTNTFTAVPTFTPTTVPNPVPIAPSGVITATQPTFSWTSVGTNAWYYLWVAGQNGHVLDQWYDGYFICNPSICSVTPPQTLLGGSYQWWIQAWTPNNGYGIWSQPMAFTVDAPPPVAVPIAPIGTIIPHPQITFTWEGFTGSAWYYLWLDGPTGHVIDQWYDGGLICTSGTCDATLDQSLVGGTYHWWIQMWTPAGGYSAWSQEAVFVVPLSPAAPSLIAPLGTVNSNQPTFVWTHSPAVTWFYLWLSDANGRVLDQWFNAYDICGGGTCQLPAPLMLPNGSYSWWIQGWSPEGSYGAWSAQADFIIAAALPDEVASTETP